MHHKLEIMTCDPLNYIIDDTILILVIYLGGMQVLSVQKVLILN